MSSFAQRFITPAPSTPSRIPSTFANTTYGTLSNSSFISITDTEIDTFIIP